MAVALHVAAMLQPLLGKRTAKHALSAAEVERRCAVPGQQVGHLGHGRQPLLGELAESVGATVELKADGQAVVVIAGHVAAGIGDYRPLSLSENADGEPVVSIGMDAGAFDITGEIGGAVGGLVAARTQMSTWVDDLDAFAFTVGSAFNTQNAAGFDTAGTAGAAAGPAGPAGPW